MIKKAIGFMIGCILIFGMFNAKAQDNKTMEFTERGWPKILEEDKWPSHIIYDTVGACYQGTIRWIVISNPSLYGQLPTLAAQRQMVEHCFCVMDKIRHEIKLEEYLKKVIEPEWTGNLFMLKAMECTTKYKTLPSFFVKAPDNETITNDNDKIVTPEDKPKDSQDEPPGQKPKESENGLPATIFQG